jgi:hypothetical protein
MADLLKLLNGYKTYTVSGGLSVALLLQMLLGNASLTQAIIGFGVAALGATLRNALANLPAGLVPLITPIVREIVKRFLDDLLAAKPDLKFPADVADPVVHPPGTN